MKKLNNQGFSLVELIIVIAIMAVLIGVLAPTYLGQVKKANVSTDLQNAQQVATAVLVKAAESEAGGTALAKNAWTTITFGGSDKVVAMNAPVLKASAEYTVWAYYFDGTNLKVGVAQADETLSDTSVVVLYPTRPAKNSGTPWDAE